ncbi:MAG: Dabb family protein [Chloroflexota bacterium]
MLHIVLLQPKPGATEEQFGDLWREIGHMAGRIPGIVSVAFGPNRSVENLEQGYTQGFTVRFTDRAARDSYLPHPDHLAVVPFVRAVADRVLVFDLEG